MKRSFPRKKIFSAVAFFSAACVFCSLLYARALCGAERLDVARTFWFLASSEENVAASVASVYLSGGAGYALERDGRACSVLACYRKERDAQTVSRNLSARGISVFVFGETGGMLYLKSSAEKSAAGSLKGWFDTLYGCISLLYETAGKADAGATQRILKSLISDATTVLFRLCGEWQGVKAEQAAYALRAYTDAAKIARSVVYARDIRRLQVYLCDVYLLSSELFAL